MSETQIYIRGFPRPTRQDDIRKAFIEYGPIREVRMLGAYAFVTYENPEDAQVAVKEMDGKDFDNSKIKVQIAGKPKKSKGPQPTDECRFCHKLGHWKNDCPEYKKQGYSGYDERRRRRRSESDDSSSSSSRSRKHRKSKSKKSRKDKSKSKRRRRSPSSQSSRSSSSQSSSSRSSSSEKKEKHKKKKKVSRKSEQANGEAKDT